MSGCSSYHFARVVHRGTELDVGPLSLSLIVWEEFLQNCYFGRASEAPDEDWRHISEATKLVVFLSTPHTGSAMANVLDAVPFTSKQIKLLSNDTGFLHELNEYYRDLASEREDRLSTAVYYEKHLTKKLAVVVERGAADPGVGRSGRLLLLTKIT